MHKDSLKEQIYDCLGVTTTKTFTFFTALIEEQLANRVDLIVEATFDFADDARLLREWEERYGLELICVVCDADAALRKQRITTRERHESHAEADKGQLLRADTAKFDHSGLTGKKILIQTTTTPEHSLTQALTAIAS